MTEDMKDHERRTLAASVPDDMRDALREFNAMEGIKYAARHPSPTGRIAITREEMDKEAYERIRDIAKNQRVAIVVGAGIAGTETARLLREAMSERGYDVLIDAPREVVRHRLVDMDFAALELRVAAAMPHRFVQVKTRKRERGNGFTYRVLYGAGKFADVDEAVRRVRLAQNKRKAQRRARTGRK